MLVAQSHDYSLRITGLHILIINQQCLSSPSPIDRCIHAFIHTFKHTCTYTYIHTHTYIHACMHAYTHHNS